MKKRYIFGVTGLALALAASAFAFNNVKPVAADGEGAPYGFVDFAYNANIESAFPESWAWADPDTSFTNEQVSWKVSSGRRSGGNDKFYLGFTNDATEAELRSILNRTDDEDYVGMVTATGQTSGFGYAIMSEGYIEDINDLHVSFSAEAGYFYVLYHLPTDLDGVWNLIKDRDGNNAFPCDSTTYAGAHDEWDGGYGSFNWTFSNILGHTGEHQTPRAQIAFVYWCYNYKLDCKLNYISINTDLATAGYLNGLADNQWCTDPENPTLNKTTLGIYADHLSEAQNTTLKNTAITGALASKTTYTNYYDLFNYVCEIIGVTLTNPLSARYNVLANEVSFAPIIICSVLLASAAALTKLVVLKKKRHSK